MYKIVNIVDRLKSTNSRKDKEQILAENKDNILLQKILKFVYNPYIRTGMCDKKLNKNVDKFGYTYTTISEVMEYLIKNNTGQDIDIATVKVYLSYLCKEERNLATEIITKNLKMGITAKTINKVFGETFIPIFEVMRAKNLKEHINKVTGSFTLTEKINGLRCIIIKHNNKIKFMSRQGHLLEGLGHIEKELAQVMPDSYVLDGELLHEDIDGLSSEELFNLTTSIVRAKDKDKSKIKFFVFDSLPYDEFITGKSNKSYSTRRIKTYKILKNTKSIKTLRPFYIGTDLNEAYKLLDELSSQDKEGLMLNINNRKYESKRTDAILKVIKYNIADVKVAFVIEGSNKNKNKLGSIVVGFTHQDRYYTSECGTGFSDQERIDFWNNPNMLIGKIVTIEYKGISKNRDGSYGLRNASWKRIIRNDKDEISMY